METLNELIEALKGNLDILFSGAGTEAVKLFIIMAAGFCAWISKKFVVSFTRKIRRGRTQQNESPPTPEPASIKNRLIKPIFKIECLSYGGTRGITQFAGFKVINQGGSAYNVEISGECLPKKIYIGDILRQRSKSFRVDLSPDVHWEIIDFQIHYLDKDGDEGKQGLWLRWKIGGGYVVPE